MMTAAGLSEVTHRPLTFGACTLYVGVKGDVGVKGAAR